MMKRSLFYYMGVFLLMAGCSPTLKQTGLTKHTPGYGQYQELADALKYEPALQVTGSGRTTRILSLRSLASDKRPEYLVNGINLGNDYQTVNDMVKMEQVRSIRVLKSLAEKTIYGNTGDKTIIEIKTGLP